MRVDLGKIKRVLLSGLNLIFTLFFLGLSCEYIDFIHTKYGQNTIMDFILVCYVLQQTLFAMIIALFYISLIWEDEG